MQGVYERFPIQMLIRYRYRHIHGRIKIERTGGSICVTPVVGIHCVHYIEEKDCTARSATGGTYMTDSWLKTKQVHTSHTGGSVQPRAPLVYFLYGYIQYTTATQAQLYNARPLHLTIWWIRYHVSRGVSGTNRLLFSQISDMHTHDFTNEEDRYFNVAGIHSWASLT